MCQQKGRVGHCYQAEKGRRNSRVQLTKREVPWGWQVHGGYGQHGLGLANGRRRGRRKPKCQGEAIKYAPSG